MRNDSYTDFDLELRSMLQDAQEEVPSGVWESLSSELDRRDRRKVVALRWRRAAAGVAAVAAVLSGIFVMTRTDVSQGPSDLQPVVAQTVVEQAAPQDETLQEEVPSIEEQIASSRHSGAFARAEIDVPSSEASGETVPSEIAPEEDFTMNKVSDVKVSEEPWTDPFAGLEDEESSWTPGRSFSVSGNAMNNDITGSARQMKAPTAVSKASTGIQEKSVSTYGIPLTLGVGARFELSPRLSVGTGIDWSLLSRSFTGIYTEVDDAGLVTRSVNSEINNEIHYIGVPLNLYYSIVTNRNLKFYVWGGGSVEKGLVNSYRIQNGSGDIHYKESVGGLQWSSALGLGLEFALNDYLGLYVDPSARYYFDCNQPTSVRTQKPFMLNFEVGLRFNL